MGVEAFGVSMRFNVPEARKQVELILAQYSQIHLCQEKAAFPEVATFEYNDGKHFIDFQLRQIDSNECILAVRFSLCSFDSVDAIFVEIVNRILSLFEADVSLMTSALHQKDVYLPGDSAWLIAALPDEITAMRSYWQKLFGNKQGMVRSDDSFSFIRSR